MPPAAAAPASRRHCCNGCCRQHCLLLLLVLLLLDCLLRLLQWLGALQMLSHAAAVSLLTATAPAHQHKQEEHRVLSMHLRSCRDPPTHTAAGNLATQSNRTKTASVRITILPHHACTSECRRKFTQ
jgi:hypothetical protein